MAETGLTLTRKEAARILGYSVGTLARWASLPGLNGLPFLMSPQGRVRFLRADVEAWIKRGRREPGG